MTSTAVSPGRALRVPPIASDALVVVVGVVTYFGVRGVTAASEDVALDHAQDIVQLEMQLGVFHEAAFQELALSSDTLSTLFNWIYIFGHWPVIAVTMVWLAMRQRVIFTRLRNAMIVSGGLGLVVYVSYPVAPPRLAQLGLVDTVTERSEAYRVLQPPAFVNQYAAMPSLHVGWDLLVGLAILAAASVIWLRVLGVAMPVLMAAATVATANHYVLDAVAGVLFALAGWYVALWVEHRSQRRVQPPRLVRLEPGTAQPLGG